MYRRVVMLKLTDVSEVRTASSGWHIAMTTEAVRASETSVNFNVTTRIPEDSKLHTPTVRTLNLTTRKLFPDVYVPL
jgi:hypothetical protein